MVRIVAPDGAYDYQNKYFTDDVQYHVPERPAGRARSARSSASSLAAYRTLGCRGWGRADLMIRASDRKPFLLEMNTSPGMTTHSLVPMSARAAGISYEELCLHAAGRGDAGLARPPRRADAMATAMAAAIRRCPPTSG